MHVANKKRNGSNCSSFLFNIGLPKRLFPANIMNDNPWILHVFGQFKYGFIVQHIQQLWFDLFILTMHGAWVLFGTFLKPKNTPSDNAFIFEEGKDMKQ